MSSPGGIDSKPTRKDRREEARSERRAAEASSEAHAARRKRLTLLGGIVTAVVVVIAIIVLTTGGASKSHIPATGTAQQQIGASVASELAGIPQAGNTLGKPTAPVTLQYFGDLECPFCREFTISSLPSLIAKYVRTGKVKLQYRSLETATREPAIFGTQQVAALAAGKQNHMWDYVEIFYNEQGQEDSGYVTESYLQGIAKQVTGLNLSQWSSDRNDSLLSAQITSDEQAANQAGLTGTPSFLLGKSGGALSSFTPSSFTEPSSFEAAIEKLLS
jgi:protein-disulfide isomerase